MHKYSKVRGILRAKQGSQIPKLVLGNIIELNPYKDGLIENQPLYDGIDSWRDINISNMNYTNPIPDFRTSQTGHLGSGSGSESVVKKPSIFNNLKEKLGTEIKNGIKNGIKKIDADTIVSGVNMGIDMLGKQFNDTEDSKGVDNMFALGNSASKLVGKINPAAGLALKAFNTGLLGLNSLFGKNSRQFSVDQQTAEIVGGSYGDSMGLINDAASKAGKKYGWFSNKKRKKANALINEAERQQNIMTDIADEATDQRAMVNDLNYIDYNFNLSGGYDQRYMRAAKSGMKLLDKINFIKQRKINTGIINLDTKEIDWEPEVIIFKTGGVIEPDYDIIYEIPKVEEFQKGGKTRTLEELIEYAKKENPRFIQRLSESPHGIEFVDDEGNKGVGNVYLEWGSDDEGNAIIYPRILEMDDRSLKFLSRNEAWKRANKNNNILIMSPEEAQIFFAEDSEYQTAYKRGWPEMFKNYSEKIKSSMKEGGKTKEELETPEIEETTQKNLIPEGALHKNKHHIEHTEGLTLKGIPVIDNDGEQLAEIELDEIIFTLEVTKKLEELYKEGTDEAAIEAGKLLVKEILFNTDDRTGLISKCEKGGKICQIEE